MPHLTLEYTHNLAAFDPADALTAVNEAMFDSGLFSEPDIKSRAIGLDCFQVGELPGERGFVHVRIAMLAGRSNEERKLLADKVLAALIPTVNRKKGLKIQISVETAEIDLPSYAKAVIDD